MGKYSVPENIRKMKPTGTSVKPIGGGYYVYAQKHIKSEKTGKWTIKTGAYLGKIDPKKGFVPKEVSDNEEITVLEFGQYAAPYLACQEILTKLESCFDIETANKIFLIALVYLINGFTYQKYIYDYIDISFLKVFYKRWKFGENAISNFLAFLGGKYKEINEFEKDLYSGINLMAVDGHAIASESENNDLTCKGNKYPTFRTQQVNLIMGYDVKSKKPVWSEIISGNCIDSVCFDDILTRRKFNNIEFVIDKGFFSINNLKSIEKYNCKFIIPCKENLKELHNLKQKSEFVSNHFVYKSGTSKTVIYFEQTKTSDGWTLYGFRDLTRHAIECDDYQCKIEVQKEGYSQEKFEILQHNFGTAWLLTNSNEEPQNIFEKYKKRWTIETFYNNLKNKLDFNALHCQDYYIEQSLSFIILVTALMQNEMKQKMGLTKNFSLEEFLIKARRIKIKKDNGIWHPTAVTLSLLDEFKKANLDTKGLINEINEIDNLH